MNFSELQGKTMTTVTAKVGGNEVCFVSNEGKTYLLYHNQDCCESVTIEDITGDLNDLIGTPILLAEEATSNDPPPGAVAYDSDTWTFYKLRTIKGSVDIRWHGTSNGYYSESVSFCEEKP